MCTIRTIERDPDSHKGQNGTVAVIGGSLHMHGAPILSALAAEKTGADLTYVALPKCHEEVAKHASLNFQVHAFKGNHLAESDLEDLLELLAVMDCAVIGPGLSVADDSLHVIRELVDGAVCPLVLDAAALQPFITTKSYPNAVVCTPHLGELERMELLASDLPEVAQRTGATFFLKGKTDLITAPDGMQQTVEGGNAGLTVGGTGDTLAGMIAGLIAQGMDATEACVTAATVMKTAGESLFTTRGYAYSAHDVLGLIPFLIKDHA